MSYAKSSLWAAGRDESVEVNQRALIDKVLARYSGEFTVFRELLQNSDDAQSKAVEIRFETKQFLDARNNETGEESLENGTSELPDLKTALVHQWVFKNNGILFRPEDWSRLKKIAEGNPDEEKIGAFGVGFYSLFSVTDEPFVASGGEWMGFYWKDKKDQLFARRGQLDSAPTTWTFFEMPLREPAPIPPAFDFTRFLASSITFMAYLSEVSVYFDDICLTRLKKSSGLTRTLTIPPGLTGTNRSRIMNVTGIRATPLHIKAEVMRWVYSAGAQKPVRAAPVKPSGAAFFASVFGFATPQRTPSPLPQVETVDMREINETSVTLSIITAEVNVRLDKKIKGELHRSTQKNPPSKLKYELIYTEKDEYDASVKEDQMQPFAAGSVFQGLRADLEGLGHSRIFIGHSTSQTTGISGHMSSRFIPTVERESIDLMDRSVAVWNKELLYIGGFLSRAAYELEMAEIRALWPSTNDTSNQSSISQSRLTSRAAHALKFFTFRTSTPSEQISILLELAFFNCSKTPLSVISSAGVQSLDKVRLPDASLSDFIKNVPTLSPELTSEKGLIASLQRRNLVKPITFEDVLMELRSRPLSEEEMVACLKWWISIYERGDNPKLSEIQSKLLEAAVVIIGSDAQNTIMPLSSVRTFVNQRGSAVFIPIDGPLPDHVLPFAVSKNFQPGSLANALPWTELSVLDWVTHISSPSVCALNPAYDLKLSVPWAGRVLSVLARFWPSISGVMQSRIVEVLKGIPFIPTTQGLQLPKHAYFPSVKLFSDLSIVSLPPGMSTKGAMEKILISLGVRKHVDLQVVFDRMFKTGDWTVADLVKYFVHVRSEMSPLEIGRLRETAAFTAEQNLAQANEPQRSRKYCASELYEPLDIHRILGLPVIDWGTQSKWRSTSEEGKLLFGLGLRRHPPLNIIIDRAANADAEISRIALNYLIEHTADIYSDYESANFSNIAYVPALQGHEPCMRNPKEVYTNPEWALLGFAVVQPQLRLAALNRLQIPEEPEASLLISVLERSPPKDEVQARAVFSLLAKRVSDFTPAELSKISSLPIVPVLNPQREKSFRWLPPNECFLRNETDQSFHSELFHFVDFGRQANSFLRVCGTKQDPSVEEVTLALLADPHKFYRVAGGPAGYLTELRLIAINLQQVSLRTLSKMQNAPILLGAQRIPRVPSKADYEKSFQEELDEEDWELQYDLKKPGQIVIADDAIGYRLFGDSIFTAPQEDLLEAFYARLGSPHLSTLIREDYKTSSEIKKSRKAEDIRRLILDRLPLFLHEHTHSQTRVPYKWLSTNDNFVVKTFGKISVTKSLAFGDNRLSRNEDASAVAKQVTYGPVQLWLAENCQVELYEVATALCRLIFESPKLNDNLLLMTILSTDLQALKRRGYNVNRILSQQTERQAVEAASARAKNDVLLSEHSAPPPPYHQSGEIDIELATSTSNDTDMMGPTPPPKPSFGASMLNSLRNRIQNHSFSPLKGNSSLPNRGENKQTITSMETIAKNIDQAIQACTAEQESLLQNREHMQLVKEALDECYCDISPKTDLQVVGNMGEIKVFASQEISDPKSIFIDKQDVIARFIHVILPLAGIYNIPRTSLHIFFDVTGGVIALNRNGSIFLNLRYYEAWHDADVHNGNLSRAYTSWYLSLAHEIAHNLVHPHNSEHEFYFSAICEAHIMDLAKLLMGS